MASVVVQIGGRGAVHGRRQHVHDGFVGGHHDGSVGNLPHQLCGQAAVQALVALLAPHEQQRLEEGPVLLAFLP